MFGLGPTELIVILVLALLVLGPKRIPEAASTLGKAIRGFRRATKELKDQIDIDDEVRKPFEDLRSALRDEPLRPVYPPLITSPPEETFPRVPIDETPASTVPEGPGGEAAQASPPSGEPASSAAAAPASAPAPAKDAAPAAAPPSAHVAAEHTK